MNCKICKKEIDPGVMPFELKTTRRYDGEGRIKNAMNILFKTPYKEKKFHFHQECAENAIFEKMRLTP